MQTKEQIIKSINSSLFLTPLEKQFFADRLEFLPLNFYINLQKDIKKSEKRLLQYFQASLLVDKEKYFLKALKQKTKKFRTKLADAEKNVRLENADQILIDQLSQI